MFNGTSFVPFLNTGLKTETEHGSIILNGDGSYSFYKKGIIDDTPLFTDRIVAKFADISNLTSWTYINSINSDAPDNSWSNNGFVSTKSSAAGKLEYKYISDAKWKSQLEATNLSALNTKAFGFDQIIDLNRDTISFGGVVRNLDNFDGQTFDKAFLDSNKGKVLELLNSVNLNFDLGYDYLYSVTVHDTGANKSQLVFDYRTSVPLLSGQTLIIDPTFGYDSTGTGYQIDSADSITTSCTVSPFAESTGFMQPEEGDSSLAQHCSVGIQRWDTSTLPASILVTNATIRYDISALVGGGEPCNWNSVEFDPATATPETEFYDAQNGTQFVASSAQCQSVANDKILLLPASAWTDIQTKAPINNWWAVGVTPNDMTRNGTRYANVFTSNTSTELQIDYVVTGLGAVNDLSNSTNPGRSYIGLNWTAPSVTAPNTIIGYQINVTTPQTNNPIVLINDTNIAPGNFPVFLPILNNEFPVETLDQLRGFIRDNDTMVYNAANYTQLLPFFPVSRHATGGTANASLYVDALNTTGMCAVPSNTNIITYDFEPVLSPDWTSNQTAAMQYFTMLYNKAHSCGKELAIVPVFIYTSDWNWATISTVADIIIMQMQNFQEAADPAPGTSPAELGTNMTAVTNYLVQAVPPTTELYYLFDDLGHQTGQNIYNDIDLVRSLGIDGVALWYNPGLANATMELPVIIDTMNILDSNYNVTGLVFDTSYSARVGPWTNVTNGHPLNNATGNVFNFTTADGIQYVTTAPTLVVIDNHTNTSVLNLDWTAPSLDGINGYRISREAPVGGGFSTLVSNTSSTQLWYNDTGLFVNTFYNYKLRAMNSTGYSTFSNPYSATTHHTPDAVTNLTVTMTDLLTATLTWVQPTLYGYVTGYQINYTTPQGDPVTIYTNTTGSSAVTTSVGGLTSGDVYSFRVSAVTFHGKNATGGAIANGTAFSQFDVGSVYLPTTDNPNDIPISFTVSAVNSTTSDLKVIYDSSYSLACDFVHPISQTNQTYSSLTENPIAGSEVYSNFTINGIGNDLIDVHCWNEADNSTNGDYRLNISAIPIIDQIHGYQTGLFGSSGKFGALDLMTIIVVIISMVGFNRTHPIVGVGFMVVFLGAMTYYGAIAIETTALVSGMLVLMFVLAVIHGRRDDAE